MRFYTVLISSFLLSSAKDSYSSFDAGITLISKHNVTFHTIEGGMKTRQVSGNVNDSVTAYVTLDSEGCSNSVSVGVTCTMVEALSSKTLCRAWVDSVPGIDGDFPDFPINTGETIIFGATAPYSDVADQSMAHGVRVFVQNADNSTLYRDTTFDDYKPCGKRAGWAVGYPPDHAVPGYRLPIAHFGRLELPSSVAYGLKGESYGPSDHKMAHPHRMMYSNGSLIAFPKVEGGLLVVTDIRAANPNEPPERRGFADRVHDN